MQQRKTDCTADAFDCRSSSSSVGRFGFNCRSSCSVCKDAFHGKHNASSSVWSNSSLSSLSKGSCLTNQRQPLHMYQHDKRWQMHQKFLRPTWNEAQQVPCRITTWPSFMVYDMFIYLWVHRWHPVQCAGRTAECWRWVECLPRSSLTFRGFFWSGGSPVRNNRKQVPLTKCTVKICCSIVLFHPIFMLAGWLLLLSLSFESFVSFMFMPFCFPFGYISTSAKPKPLLTIINHLFWNELHEWKEVKRDKLTLIIEKNNAKTICLKTE